jgi:phosphate transport system substrate-binding protein
MERPNTTSSIIKGSGIIILKILFYVYLVVGMYFMLIFLIIADEARYGWHRGGFVSTHAELFYSVQSFITYSYAIIAALSLITIAIKPIKPKIRYTVSLLITMSLLVTSFVFERLDTRYADEHFRIRNLETVNQSVDLALYRPFSLNTRAVSLSEESTLRFTDNLPLLDGATAFYPIYAAFAQAVYPPENYSHFTGYDPVTRQENEASGIVACSTTPVAYERLINSETDIIFVLGISDEHAALAAEKGVELTFTPIGKEAFVFFANAKNPVYSLTCDEIRQIYSGQITNWHDLGGVNEKIRAYQRNIGSGSQTAFLEFVGDIDLIEPASDDIFIEMMGIINHTTYRNHENAIGYSFRYFVTEMAGNNAVRLLAINGISPTLENIENGTYPLIFDFYAVTVKGSDEDNPNISTFIEWILGEQGQYLIKKTGYTPIKLNTERVSSC